MVLWIIGLLTGMALLKVIQLLKNKEMVLKWYHYLAAIVWYLYGFFVIMFVNTSIIERETQVVGTFLLIFGGIFVALTVAFYFLVFNPKNIMVKRREVK